AQGNGASIDARLKTVFNAILNQRLQQHGGNKEIQGLRGDVFDDAELFRTESCDFNIQIIVGKLQLIAQLHQVIAILQQNTQNTGQLYDQFPCLLRTEPHQGSNGVECVEKKVRIDLTLKSVQSCFQ